MENRPIKRIKKAKSWFFEISNEIHQPVFRLIQEKQMERIHMELMIDIATIRKKMWIYYS